MDLERYQDFVSTNEIPQKVITRDMFIDYLASNLCSLANSCSNIGITLEDLAEYSYERIINQIDNTPMPHIKEALDQFDMWADGDDTHASWDLEPTKTLNQQD